MLLLIAFVCYNLLKELKIRNFFLIKKNYTLKIFSALNHFVFDFSKYCTKYWKDLVFKFWMTMQQYIPRYVYIIYFKTDLDIFIYKVELFMAEKIMFWQN